MFISHSTLAIVIAPDEDPQLYIGLSPGIKTMPLEELSFTRNKIVHKVMYRNTHHHIA